MQKAGVCDISKTMERQVPERCIEWLKGIDGCDIAAMAQPFADMMVGVRTETGGEELHLVEFKVLQRY